MNVEGGAIAYFAVSTTDMTREELSWFVDNTIVKDLISIKGVAQVGRGGGVDREIRIELDPAKLQSFGITAVQVNSQLQQLNLDAPGGRTQIAGAEQSLRVLGGAKTAVELGATRIAITGGRTVALSEIAEVRDSYGEVRSVSLMNGREVTSFGVFKAKGASEVTVWNEMNERLDAIKKAHPEVKFDLLFTSVDYTKMQYNSAMIALVEGAILAVIVVWFFLRDWRATLISAFAIPLSAIPTFFFMEAMGFTLNTISLLALSLVAGILVDDAIVEIENIVRHMRMGKTAYQASLDAADEIGLAVVATTFSIVAVFLPVAFMGGVSGQYFEQFGLTVSIAVLMSLLVARLITPLMAAYFLSSKGAQPHGEAGWIKAYMRVLHWSLEHRWVVIAGAFVAFAFTILGFMRMPQTFQPTIDVDYSQVEVELPPGVRLEDTRRVALQVSQILEQRPEVKAVFADAGDGGEVNEANLYITLKPAAERDISSVEFEKQVAAQLDAIPDARVNFRSQRGGFGRDITIMLAGDDPVKLEKAGRDLVEGMKTLPMLRAPRIDGDYGRPEVTITPRFDLAADLGVSVAALSQTVRIATIGDVEQNLAKFSLSDRQIPIRVSLKEESRTDLSTLENLPVPTASGGSVPLKVVADIRFGEGPSVVRRFNQVRRLAIGADLASGETGPAYEAVYALPAFKNLPDGVEQVKFGDTEMQEELANNFIVAIVAGVLLVFSVLLLLYKRVFPPFINMASLLLAPAGAVLILAVLGMPISMPVYIGILMLFGIVAKNSILLVDFAIEEQRLGKNKIEAIEEAGHKRAQPIVMTTIAMVAGMLPIALNLHGDGSWRSPMAIAVIGGLTLSTILTLIIVPAAYSVADDVEKWVGRYAARIVSSDAAASAPALADGPARPAALPGGPPPAAPLPAE
jgi:multidrug efflux pump subunit AcrB